MFAPDALFTNATTTTTTTTTAMPPQRQVAGTHHGLTWGNTQIPDDLLTSSHPSSSVNMGPFITKDGLNYKISGSKPKGSIQVFEGKGLNPMIEGKMNALKDAMSSLRMEFRQAERSGDVAEESAACAHYQFAAEEYNLWLQVYNRINGTNVPYCDTSVF